VKKLKRQKNRGADDLTLLGAKAYLAFSSGFYKKAAELYSKSYQLRPSATLLNNTAFSYWREGALVKAEETINGVLSLVPNNFKAIRLQANIWLLQGKLDKAIINYQNIVSQLNNGTDLTNLSLAYALNKQYEKSFEFARKALNQSPNHPVKLLNLADVEMLLGNAESAKVYYQKVIEILIGKNEVKYLTNLAQAYAHMQQANLAITSLKQAQNLAPKNGEVSYAASIVYSLLGEKASAIYQVELALNENIGVVWFNLPWFDELCSELTFQNLMIRYKNSQRCLI
jgi:serine/threonine-protein kinase